VVEPALELGPQDEVTLNVRQQFLRLSADRSASAPASPARSTPGRGAHGIAGVTLLLGETGPGGDHPQMCAHKNYVTSHLPPKRLRKAGEQKRAWLSASDTVAFRSIGEGEGLGCSTKGFNRLLRTLCKPSSLEKAASGLGERTAHQPV
jgi:hypothetical protein